MKMEFQRMKRRANERLQITTKEPIFTVITVLTVFTYFAFTSHFL